MKTTVKYVVLKSKDYQLGTPLFEEELDVDGQYFDQIPLVVHFQNRSILGAFNTARISASVTLILYGSSIATDLAA